LSSVTNTAGDFLTLSGGVVHKRTAAQTLTDIGGQAALTNPVTGTGTSGTIPVFTGSTTIGNSIIQSNTTQVNIVGNGSALLFDSLGESKTGGIQYTNSFELLVYNSRGTGSSINLGNTNLDLNTNTTGNPRLRITDGGNILIGTTTEAGFKLDVNGTGRFNSTLNVVNSSGATTPSNYLQIEGSVANNSNYPGISLKGGTLATTYPSIALTNGGLALVISNGIATAYNNPAQISLNNGNISFFTGDNAAATEKVRIAIGGSVGINNTSPMNSAWGTDATTKQLSIDASAYAVINLTGSTSRKYSMGVGDGNFYMCYDNTAGRHNIVVSSGGNVLIGTTTAGSSKLRIVGLPTSAAGLSSGDVYNLSGVLMIA